MMTILEFTTLIAVARQSICMQIRSFTAFFVVRWSELSSKNSLS